MEDVREAPDIGMSEDEECLDDLWPTYDDMDVEQEEGEPNLQTASALSSQVVDTPAPSMVVVGEKRKAWQPPPLEPRNKKTKKVRANCKLYTTGGSVALLGLVDLLDRIYRGLYNIADVQIFEDGFASAETQKPLTLSIGVSVAGKHGTLKKGQCPFQSGGRSLGTKLHLTNSGTVLLPRVEFFLFYTQTKNSPTLILPMETQIKCISSHFDKAREGEGLFSFTFSLRNDEVLVARWVASEVYVVRGSAPPGSLPIIGRRQFIQPRSPLFRVFRSVTRFLSYTFSTGLCFFFAALIAFLTRNNERSKALWMSILNFALRDKYEDIYSGYEAGAADLAKEDHFLILTQVFFTRFLANLSNCNVNEDLRGKIHCIFCGGLRGCHDLTLHSQLELRFPEIKLYVNASPHFRDAIFGIFAELLCHPLAAPSKIRRLVQKHYHCPFCGLMGGSHDSTKHKAIEEAYKRACGFDVNSREFDSAFSGGSLPEDLVEESMLAEMSMLQGGGLGSYFVEAAVN